jgi:hypothetical protein
MAKLQTCEPAFLDQVYALDQRLFDSESYCRSMIDWFSKRFNPFFWVARETGAGVIGYAIGALTSSMRAWFYR